MNTARLVINENVQLPAFTGDVAGHLVDLGPSTWRLNSVADDRVINWESLTDCDSDAVDALRLHVVRLIETKSTNHTRNVFGSVAAFLTDIRDDVSAPSKKANLASMLWWLERLRADRVGYRFHHVRQWYVASADRFLDGFEDEVIYALNDLRIEGNAKGEAVLSYDPTLGPLSEFEEEALRSALLRDRGPIDQRAALWLSFAFGPNPSNLSLLREDDFSEYLFSDDIPAQYFLKLPRIKKRLPARTEFKTRSVDGRLATVIKELIAWNRAVAPDDPNRPLFRTESSRPNLVNGPLHDFANHRSAIGITGLISQCVGRLKVISPRTRKPLKITTRRLRYTFASKMVRQGIAARDLAELLDHSDTQHVQVYYKADSRFVERLDSTIAEHYGPTIKAFMGEVVARATVGIDHIPFRDLPALGACGANFSCGLAPHKNCYTCDQFKAFDDGPHETALIDLIVERDDLLAANKERIAEQLDRTILAVGEVVAAIRSRRVD